LPSGSCLAFSSPFSFHLARDLMHHRRSRGPSELVVSQEAVADIMRCHVYGDDGLSIFGSLLCHNAYLQGY